VSERTSHIYATTDRWEMVCGALLDQNVTDPRPAPAASLSFKPRHARAHHAAGSDAAQRDLQALAGWAPSRRNILATLLAFSAGPAAAALPKTGAVSNSVPLTSVSPRMSQLIADAIRLNAIGSVPNTDAADAADDAITALVNETPATLADLAAKLTAIAETMPNDCGSYVLQRLAGDATHLVGEAK
jgi:hypothetical protein